MSRFNKIVLSIVTLVVLGSGAAIVLYTKHLESLVRDATQTALTDAFGDAPGIERLSFDAFEGELSIDGLSIPNPPGFADAAAVEVGGISALIDMNSLTGVRVEVLSLTLRDVHLRLQQNDSGLINLQVIEDRVGLQQVALRDSGERSRRFAIAEYQLQNVSFEAVTPRGERYGLLLPDQNFSRLGYDSGGLPVPDAILNILQPIFTGVIATAVEEDLLPDESGEEQTLRDLKRMIDAINAPPGGDVQ